MTNINSPTKYAIRQYLDGRSHSTTPPPSPEEIRRQLGWQLLKSDARAWQASAVQF
ncbi:MAG: hypothetical protein ACHP7O_10545 [Burkholderiales bacterium]